MKQLTEPRNRFAKMKVFGLPQKLCFPLLFWIQAPPFADAPVKVVTQRPMSMQLVLFSFPPFGIVHEIETPSFVVWNLYTECSADYHEFRRLEVPMVYSIK